MLIVDASFVVRASFDEGGFDDILGAPLVAPPLLWSEVPSVLHEAKWRGAISPELAEASLTRFLDAPISEDEHADLIRMAWSVSERLGWAKTYGAQYVALAEAFECKLLTIDRRLRRGAARLIETIGPDEL